MNMDMSNDVYIGKNIVDIGTVSYCISKDEPILGIFCICRTNVREFHVEIIASMELCRHKERYVNYVVIGFAMGKYEAMDLLKKMVEDTPNRFLSGL